MWMKIMRSSARLAVEILTWFWFQPVNSTETCRTSILGQDYTGQVSVTSSGITCQRWDAQSPHLRDTSMTPSMLPEGNYTAAENYCRNPDGEDGGPWCFTTDPNKRWSYCDVPLCPYVAFNTRTCRTSIQGREYTGNVSVTSLGKTCQRWDAQSPHQRHSGIAPNAFPEGDYSAAENYCRNPDGEPGPWCYTTDPDDRYQQCDVPFCPAVSVDWTDSGEVANLTTVDMSDCYTVKDQAGEYTDIAKIHIQGSIPSKYIGLTIATRDLQSCHQEAILFLSEVPHICPFLSECQVTENDAHSSGRCVLKCLCDNYTGCYVRLKRYPVVLGYQWSLCYISAFFL